MAKVTGYSVPPALMNVSLSVITTTTGAGGTKTRATKRRGSGRQRKKAVEPYPENAFLDAATYIERKISPDSTERELMPIIRKRVRDMKAGIFDPLWWTDAQLISTEYLSCSPSSVPDPNPPPYDFRTSANLPTIPTYTDGTPGATGMAYNGSKHGSYFQDDDLSWGRFVYSLKENATKIGEIYAFAIIDPTMTIQASHRASRPMLSIITSACITDSTDAVQNTTAPVTEGIAPSAPTQSRKAQSHYWRYKIPRTTPPYFNTVKPRKIVRDLVKSSSLQLTSTNARLVLLLAPRPMFGRGFNNNNTVSSTLAADLRIVYMLGDFAFIARRVTDMGETPSELPWSSTLATKTISGTAGCVLDTSPGYSVFYLRSFVDWIGMRIKFADITVAQPSPGVYITSGEQIADTIRYICPRPGERNGHFEFTLRRWHNLAPVGPNPVQVDLVDVQLYIGGMRREKNPRTGTAPPAELGQTGSRWILSLLSA